MCLNVGILISHLLLSHLSSMNRLSAKVNHPSLHNFVLFSLFSISLPSYLSLTLLSLSLSHTHTHTLHPTSNSFSFQSQSTVHERQHNAASDRRSLRFSSDFPLLQTHVEDDVRRADDIIGSGEHPLSASQVGEEGGG